MLAKGLKIIDLINGSGAVAEVGDVVLYHFDCHLPHGDLLHSSRESDPIQSEVGSRDLCVGISQGLIGMIENGKRSIKVPPQLSHIERKIWGHLSDNVVLRYEVELLKVIKKNFDKPKETI